MFDDIGSCEHFPEPRPPSDPLAGPATAPGRVERAYGAPSCTTRARRGETWRLILETGHGMDIECGSFWNIGIDS